jgi:hypothetical protein
VLGSKQGPRDLFVITEEDSIGISGKVWVILEKDKGLFINVFIWVRVYLQLELLKGFLWEKAKERWGFLKE